jgi:hypothetical protein
MELNSWFMSEYGGPCSHIVGAVLFVELRFRGAFMRMFERSVLAVNLLGCAAWPRLPLRNITIGAAQIAVAHHPTLSGAVRSPSGWLSPRTVRRAPLLLLLATVLSRNAWERRAMADLLGPVTCDNCSQNAGWAATVAEAYNPWDQDYELLLMEAHRALLLARQRTERAV